MVAVDLEDDKLRMARELGAEYVVNAAEQDPAAELQKLAGADAAIALPEDNYLKLPIFETVLRGINHPGRPGAQTSPPPSSLGWSACVLARNLLIC